jgi:hypothetical protein
MPKLTRGDWEKLRNGYRVAFTTWSEDAFNALLDTVYGPEHKGNPGSGSGNPGKADDADALMVSLVHAEPPIQPAAAEPPIQPGSEEPID